MHALHDAEVLMGLKHACSVRSAVVYLFRVGGMGIYPILMPVSERRRVDYLLRFGGNDADAQAIMTELREIAMTFHA